METHKLGGRNSDCDRSALHSMDRPFRATGGIIALPIFSLDGNSGICANLAMIWALVSGVRGSLLPSPELQLQSEDSVLEQHEQDS